MIVKRSSKQLLIRSIGEERYYTLWAKRKIRRMQQQGLEILFIHQMGKVGSTAVASSLRANGYDQNAQIIQTHFLSPKGRAFVEKLEVDGRGGWQNLTPRTKRFLVFSRVVGQMLENGYLNQHKSKVITLVRDPIATNISGFFHNYLWWPPRLQERPSRYSEEFLKDLYQQFMAVYPHDVPLNWFDMELKPLFGIDVLATPFPKEHGFKIYEGKLADVLLLRLDDLHDCAADAFDQFLGIKNFELVHANLAEDKWYADLYQAFKQKIVLPTSYADRVYESTYTRHFYTDVEIDAFRSKWCRL